MSPVLLDGPLESVVPYWQVFRRDGIAHGFCAHDRDLWFDGLTHRAAPGIAPSAIRLVAGLEGDSAGVSGALSHDGIAEDDLTAGRFDAARVIVGAVDCETLERIALFTGTIGEVAHSGNGFEAQLLPETAALDRDTVPRTSPTCRAAFCGPGCNLPPSAHESEVVLLALAPDTGIARFEGMDAALHRFGSLRWLDGPARGLRASVVAADGDALTIDPIPAGQPPGSRAILREGCDHTLATCRTRFGNGANFRGEAHLPGNDLLTRRPAMPG
ncbi:DUF2163 domain-containing protein [Erythrobacter sp. 3-20A1M]|uniref:DUF2163 domain-containing protein n=1 Tax=Erythrobacter sp. 3-20A1M TaxID=2653850 RepID=UPI001BFC8F60|nr:DUF2163 domain-containing protein [Erythrobacter sp. 3-20A1M]QWC56925.1 DUF2163 domain-containing protein [Erythrobacter sp. 3-20A1M]